MLTSIAAFSYSAAAVTFLLLSLLLLTSWRGRLHGIALTIACLISMLWAASILCQLIWDQSFPLLTDIFEIMRSASWSFFLLMLLKPADQTDASFFKNSPLTLAITLSYSVLLLATVYLYSMQTDHEIIIFLAGIVGRVAMALTGMILVEQLYRNTPTNGRWAIKYLCLGVGGMFAYDFYLYSDAMLFRHVNSEIWAARGIVNTLSVPLIAVSAARNAQWSLGISVSRRILFHSATLFGSAIYLLAMAAAGYFLRFFGGSWGTVLQAVFLFGAGILLFVMLFSGTLRSWLRVFISKHFFSYNYDYREEWIRFTRTLSEGEQELGERTIQAVAELVESPGGALWICNELGILELAAHWDRPLWQGAEANRSDFCQFMENTQWVIDLQEHSTNPQKYESLTLPTWLLSISKAWLVVPLIQHRKLFGFVVLEQPRSKIKLNWEICDLLKIAGNQAASYLAQQEAANALLIARQFESFNRMSTFVVHDLKNLVSQLSLLLSNIEKHKNNPEFQKDMIATVDLSVQKMKRLLEKLSSGASVEKPTPILIEKLLQQAVAAKSMNEPKPTLQIIEPGQTVLANSGSLERVIGHLIQNAIEATSKDGMVQIRLTSENETAIIEIEDNGHGMSDEFIQERLFKPFESTKSAGMGIGVFESREYTREIGGRLEVVSELSKGTTFRVILPLYKPSNLIQGIA
ncbi:MAG: PEP-CTERM system histidine kinase PrsK [Methylophilaceae bacterium]|nr:PEP-CTERM system histidine kinase PrsK [Methylophilaceae bacterium]